MADFHRDFEGNLDEPIMTWTDLELTAAANDPTLTQFERDQIEIHHGPLNDPYF